MPSAEITSLAPPSVCSVIFAEGIVPSCPGKITVHAATKSFIGPERENYPLPNLPRSAIVATVVKFDMRLADAPGPTGEALPNTEWRIVRARDEMAALACPKNILQGTSDSTGKMPLSAAEEKTLLDAYNESPNQLWVVANGHVREFILTREREDWTDDAMFYNALDAMGYTDDIEISDGREAQALQAPLARRELKANSGQSMLSKLKGGVK